MKKLFTLLSVLLTFLLVSCDSGNEEEMRIISLIPSNTEIIASLDLLDETVMVTTTDDYPKEVKDSKYEKIDVFNFDVEKVIAQKPTHIVMHESNEGMIKDALEQVKEATDAKVLVVQDAETVEDVFSDIEEVGTFLDHEKEAKDVVDKLKKDFDNVKKEAETHAETEAMAFISPPPEVYTVGKNTFIAKVFAHVKLKNAFDDMKDYPVVSNEEIVKRNPELVVNLTGLEADAFEQTIKDMQGVGSLQIAKEENQCTFDASLVSRPGPRIIEGMEALLDCTDDEQ